MWSVAVVINFVAFTAMGQVNILEVQLPNHPCTDAEQLATCRSIFFNETNFIPVKNKEVFCKARANYAICLEAAICTCNYTITDPLLENIYKDLMRNNYEFTNESCERFQTGYTPTPGISCVQSSLKSSNQFRVTQSTANQPFIISLEQNCSALHKCFAQRDRDFEVALYNKSLSAYCHGYDVFLQCYEAQVCKCNGRFNESLVVVDDFEKRTYAALCTIITGTQIIIPEIACGGTCSLSDPGVTCTQEFDKHATGSIGDEDLCRHLVSYAQCYERLVCECGLYQMQNVYTAVSIIKYTFEVKSACGRFPDIIFPSNQSGFMCPDDTHTPPEDKVLRLNTSQADYVAAEEQVCHGVAKCYTIFDTNGSLALYNKDLQAVCQTMNEEIKCLESTTCACGTLNNRSSNILRSQRAGLVAICGQGVIEISPPINCVDKSMCNTSYHLENCFNILNRQAQQGEDTQRVLCENYVNYGQCIKDISCSCHLVDDGSSIATIEIYKLLTKNAALHDAMECSPNSIISDHGLSCNNKESTEDSKRMLNLTWSLSNEKVHLVTVCSALVACFDHDDAINEEALYALDYKRVCRNQLNTLKCMEKALCKCELSMDALADTGLQDMIISHNTECSKYAPFGNRLNCHEKDVCLTAKMMDICLNRLTSPVDSTTCIEYTSYLLCVFDVACTCDLVKNGTEESAESIYKNITQVLHLMQMKQCSFNSVPERVFQKGFECYDMTTALPVQMGMLHLSFAKGEEVQQFANLCPAVVTCANKYDNTLAEALNVRKFEDVCWSALNMTQCSQNALNRCSLTHTVEAAAFDALLLSKYSGCDTGNVTKTEGFKSHHFKADAMMSVNNSQPQSFCYTFKVLRSIIQFVKDGGYVTSAPPPPSKVTAALLS